MTGLFISIDGVDGGGKSTQIQLLKKWFEARGRRTCLLRDPGGTKLGEALRDILLHRQEIPLDMSAEMLLYMASRAQLVSEVIRPAMEAGEVVLSDRYLLANVVYQGSAGGLEPDAIWHVGAIATQNLLPDLTVILDIDARTALARIDRGLDRLESRGVDYMTKVQKGFVTESERLGECALIVDATQAIDCIHAQITDVIAARGW